MRRWLPVVAFFASAPCGWAAAPNLPAALAAPVHDLTIRDAAGAAEWAAWSDAPVNRVHLALIAHHDAVWSAAWPGAYEPSLTVLSNWTYDSSPILALTMQFGAAAAELDLYGQDAHGKPVKLATKSAAAIGWTIDPAGNQLAVLYQMPASALVPSCFGWAAGGLVAANCP